MSCVRTAETEWQCLHIKVLKVLVCVRACVGGICNHHQYYSLLPSLMCDLCSILSLSHSATPLFMPEISIYLKTNWYMQAEWHKPPHINVDSINQTFDSLKMYNLSEQFDNFLEMIILRMMIWKALSHGRGILYSESVMWFYLCSSTPSSSAMMTISLIADSGCARSHMLASNIGMG